MSHTLKEGVEGASRTSRVPQAEGTEDQTSGVQTRTSDPRVSKDAHVARVG